MKDSERIYEEALRVVREHRRLGHSIDVADIVAVAAMAYNLGKSSRRGRWGR